MSFWKKTSEFGEIIHESGRKTITLSKKVYRYSYQQAGKQITKHPLVYLLLLSLIVRLIHLSFNLPLWWDSHIYIGMGKYLFSGGKEGLWESFRPLVHPLILGAFWKLGFNILVIGKILDVIFSLLAIVLTYKIGEIFSKKIAVLGSLLFSLLPLFIYHTGLILTEPITIVFGLLGIYLFIKDDNLITQLLAGLCLGLSFMAKFPQGIFFASILLVIIISKEKIITKIKNITFLSSGFLIPVIPYLVFNYFRYPNLFEPFISGSWIVSTATWLYGSGMWFYFSKIFLAFPILLFFFGYIYLFFKEKYYSSTNPSINYSPNLSTNYRLHLTLLITVILTVAYFIYVPRKEPRYLITVMPLICLLASVATIYIYQKLTEHPKPVIRTRSFAFICLILILFPFNYIFYLEYTPTFENEVQKIINKHSIDGTILSSDPFFISYFDNHLILLSGMDYAELIYEAQQQKYQLIFINDCSLICAPDDTSCNEKRGLFLRRIKEENREIFNSTYTFNSSGVTCNYYMYLPN